MKPQALVTAAITAVCLAISATVDISGGPASAQDQKQEPASTPRTEAERQQLLRQIRAEHSILEVARSNGGYFGFDFDLSQAVRGRARTLEQLIGGTKT